MSAVDVLEDPMAMTTDYYRAWRIAEAAWLREKNPETRQGRGPMGVKQTDVLRSLIHHGSWNDSGFCHWVWDTPSGTKKVLDSLVKRGFVTWTRVKRRNTYMPNWEVLRTLEGEAT